jgi:hypothetical protein
MSDPDASGAPPSGGPGAGSPTARHASAPSDRELAGPLLAAIRTSRAAAPAAPTSGSASSSPAGTPQARLLAGMSPSHSHRSPGGPGAKPRSPNTPKDMVVCRICLEEDDPSQLDRPCGCTGTLAYAHCECIQRWINERGHLVCEICEQVGRCSWACARPRGAAPGSCGPR